MMQITRPCLEIWNEINLYGTSQNSPYKSQELSRRYRTYLLRRAALKIRKVGNGGIAEITRRWEPWRRKILMLSANEEFIVLVTSIVFYELTLIIGLAAHRVVKT